MCTENVIRGKMIIFVVCSRDPSCAHIKRHCHTSKFRMHFKQLKLAKVSKNIPENRNAVQRYKSLKWS